MNGKLTQTLKTQTVIGGEGRVGQEQRGAEPEVRGTATGIGLSGVATSQFQAVEDTTIGTTQGSSSSTLKVPPAGILVRSSRARPRPTSQEPNTPTMVKIRVNRAAFQNAVGGQDVGEVLGADEVAGGDQGAVVRGLDAGVDERVAVDQDEQDHRGQQEPEERPAGLRAELALAVGRCLPGPAGGNAPAGPAQAGLGCSRLTWQDRLLLQD